MFPDFKGLIPTLLFLGAVSGLAIAVATLAGCQSIQKQAKGQADALRQSAATVAAEADAADADLADAETDTGTIAADPQATPAIKTTATRAQAKVRSGRAHVRRIRGQAPAIQRGADGMEATVAKAVDAQLAPYRRLAFWSVVLTALAVGVFWWTEKPRYAVVSLVIGGTVYAFARVAGWEQQHPYALPLAVGGVVAAVVAFEWVRHPESIKGILAGFRAGTASPATPAAAAPAPGKAPTP